MSDTAFTVKSDPAPADEAYEADSDDVNETTLFVLHLPAGDDAAGLAERIVATGVVIEGYLGGDSLQEWGEPVEAGEESYPGDQQALHVYFRAEGGVHEAQRLVDYVLSSLGQPLDSSAYLSSKDWSDLAEWIGGPSLPGGHEHHSVDGGSECLSCLLEAEATPDVKGVVEIHFADGSNEAYTIEDQAILDKVVALVDPDGHADAEAEKITKTEHLNTEARTRPRFFGAECSDHGPLLNGDWFDEPTIDRAIYDHLEAEHGVNRDGES